MSSSHDWNLPLSPVTYITLIKHVGLCLGGGGRDRDNVDAHWGGFKGTRRLTTGSSGCWVLTLLGSRK